VSPSRTGLSWFGVLVSFSAPPDRTNQVQPEPNWPTPLASNCSLNAFERAERARDGLGELAGRLTAAVGAHRLQKSV